MKLVALRPVVIAATLLAGSGLAQAFGATDAPADYVPGYLGSKAGDLDVLGAFVTYDPAADSFVFGGTMNAAIGASAGGFYVFGVNRGAGAAGFAANGIDGVLFDAVVVLRPDGSGTVNRLSGAGAGATALPAGTVLVAGSSFIGQVAGSLLPSNGFAKTSFTWNLWPRDGTLPAGFGQISDFAPDNSNLAVTVLGAVPEPASAALMGAGVLALLGLRRRRR